MCLLVASSYSYFVLYVHSINARVAMDSNWCQGPRFFEEDLHWDACEEMSLVAQW